MPFFQCAVGFMEQANTFAREAEQMNAGDYQPLGSARKYQLKYYTYGIVPPCASCSSWSAAPRRSRTDQLEESNKRLTN